MFVTEMGASPSKRWVQGSPFPKHVRSAPKDIKDGEGQSRVPFSHEMATANILVMFVSCQQCCRTGGAGDDCGQCWSSPRVPCYRSRCRHDVCDKLISLPLKSSQGFTLALPCRKLLQNLGLLTGSPARPTARLTSTSPFENLWPAATAGLPWEACPAESCANRAPCFPLSKSARRG